MGLKPLSVDDATGRLKKGGVAPTVVDFDVGGGGQAQFTIGAITITGTTYIEVQINGAEKREGATFDYQRNTGAGRIDFTFTVPEFAWVRVKIYP